MPRRTDIESVCIVGSGPIVIGQAAEFDYAGCQALKVLREDGFRTIVVNSTPATIMTDPGFADRTYIEPLDAESVAEVLRIERPDALLPTMGGQTALNLARELATEGVLDELGIELIGAGLEAIERAEDRLKFKDAVESCGLKVPTSAIVTSLDELEGLTVPAVVRPAFTLGGHGGGFAYTEDELRRQVERGLSESPIGQVLVEESVRGWDEFELEVVRDRIDNVVIVCSIENLDPMGVHTGDSVTVAPQMTLPDEAYQELRDAAAAIVREVGVECGGSNIQFARERKSGEIRVIEMNPRVSRSSALASKATGYPIAKVAAKLAVGYTLDEIPNDLGRSRRSSAARHRAARRHPRQWAEPNRPGDRVRLLLRACRAGLPRARLRGGNGQLEPGDGLDRLRHERPALLRAARRRRGARGLPSRASRGRPDPVRRSDAAEACLRARGRGHRDPRHALRRR